MCTDFMDKYFSFTYLGCPIYVGWKKICFFDDMITKVVKILNGWQGKMLTYGEKIVLVKNMLQSMPIYTLTAINPPKTSINLLERHFARFFEALILINLNISGGLGRTFVCPKMKEILV